MSSVPRLRPNRCMRGGAATFTTSNYGTVALFHNGTGRDLLAVWQMMGGDPANPTVNFGTMQGSIGGTVGPSNPIVTGDAPQYGIVTYLDSATQLTLDTALFYGPTITASVPCLLPWAILQPGWSAIVQTYTKGDNFTGFFIWQACHREDLEGKPCAVCDVTLVVT